MSLERDLAADRRRQSARATAARKLRYKTWRAGGPPRCAYCSGGDSSATAAPRERVEVHHIIPVGWGGTDDPENLVPLCRAHHVIADRLSGTLTSRTTKPAKRFRGPRTREELFDAIYKAELEEDIQEVAGEVPPGVMPGEDYEEDIAWAEFRRRTLAKAEALDLITWKLKHRDEIEAGEI